MIEKLRNLKAVDDYIRKYETRRCEAYKIVIASRYLKSGMIAIDAGAHIGFFTSIFNKFVSPDGKVIAFEPNEGNFKQLREIEESNCIIFVNSAISDYHGDGFLCTEFKNSLGYFMVEDTEYAKYINNIKVTYLDKFCTENNISKINLLKLDVEGQELKALYGAEKIIDNSDLIIIIEIHHGNDKPVSDTQQIIHKNRFPSHVDKIYNFLKSKKFRLYNLEKDLEEVTNNIVDTNRQRIEEIVAIR